VKGGWEITILSLTGQPILKTTLSAGETSKTVSVVHLPVGLYIYVVSGGDGVVSGTLTTRQRRQHSQQRRCSVG